ncbi:hypothetical protein ACHMZP_21825 [Rhodococcus baikonurensis]|uniref:hypothetical protein n=1 Tax=Rhodococcus baikonurensis TaxID=172041 RepID=UPI0037AAC419
MNAESLGVILALIVAFGSALAGAVTAWKRAPQDNITTLSARMGVLEEKVSDRDNVIDHLDRWQLAARTYIAQLRNTLADNGIEVPLPPADLEIAPRGSDH